MALTDVTTTFNLSDYIGGNFDPRRTKVYLTTNAEKNLIADKSTGEVRLGGGTVTLAADGSVSATHWAPGPDANPASWQTTYHIDFVDTATKKRQTTSIGPFTVTASGLLSALIEEQAVPAEYLTTVTAQLDTYTENAAASATSAAASASSAATSADLAQNLVTSDLGTTDGQTRALIEDPASQTATALSASIDPVAGMEIHEDFATYPDGPLTTTRNSGPPRPWVSHAASGTGTANDPVVVGGALTFANDAILGGYASLLLDNDVIQFGFEVSYGAWSTGGGVAAAAVTEREIGECKAATGGLPRMPAHVQTHPEGWSVEVNTVEATSVDSPAKMGGLHPGGNFVSDGSRRYRWHYVLDKKRERAYVFTPDGRVHTVADPGFNLPGRWVFWEPFRNAAPGSSRTLPRFHRVWADSRHVDATVMARVAALAAPPAVNTLGPTVNHTINASLSKIDGTDGTFPIPSSRQVRVTMSGFHTATTAGDHFISLSADGGVTQIGGSPAMAMSQLGDGTFVAKSFTYSRVMTLDAALGKVGDLVTLSACTIRAGGGGTVLGHSQRRLAVTYAPVPLGGNL